MKTFYAGFQIIVGAVLFLQLHQASATDYAVVSVFAGHSDSCVAQACQNPIRGGIERTELFDLKPVSAQMIVGKNSYGKFGITATAAFEPLHLGNFQAGALGGLATGYTRKQNRMEPFVAALTASYSTENFTVRIAGLPDMGRHKHGVVEIYLGAAF